jgi:hypothetical protein
MNRVGLRAMYLVGFMAATFISTGTAATPIQRRSGQSRSIGVNIKKDEFAIYTTIGYNIYCL